MRRQGETESLPAVHPAAATAAAVRAPSLRERLARPLRWRGLVQYLVVSALKEGQHSTLLGYLWWVLDPLLLMAVYVVLVDVIFDRGVPDYPVFVLAAVLPWKWFNTSINGSIGALLGRERLIKQVAFPKVVLPISQTIAQMVSFGFGLLVLLAFVLLYRIEITWALLALPLVVLLQFILTLGLAMLLSALSVFFRDIRNLLRHAFRLWFYLSPGLYPITLVPDDLLELYRLNPFARIFPAYRDAIMFGTWPAAGDLLWVLAVAAIALAVGYAAFRWAEPRFAKVL